MAFIYPTKEDISVMPYAERKVYEALEEKLGNDFYIFHSVEWMKRKRKGSETWKENDFVILNKDLGALVLEVKGGDIEYNGTVFNQSNTQTGVISVLDPEKRKDPLSQAVEGKRHFKRLLEKKISVADPGRSFKGRFPVEAAVWFPGCDISEKIKDFPPGYREAGPAILDIGSFGNVSQAIHDVFDFYGSGDKADITDAEFREIVDLIASDFVMIAVKPAGKGIDGHTYLKLSKEQTEVLDYISGHSFAKIMGLASTGKTLIAKEAAARFGREGKKVLFLCYNDVLCRYLKKHYPFENVTYYDICSFVRDLSGSDADLSENDVRAEALESIDSDRIDFDIVIIDEAISFHDREIIYFKNFAESGNGGFYMFYDERQGDSAAVTMPEWAIDDMENGYDDGNILFLRKNYRNTFEIGRTASKLARLYEKRKYLKNGEKPTLTFGGEDPTAKLEKLVKILTGDEYGYDAGDIAILSLCWKEEFSVLADIDEIAGIPVTRDPIAWESDRLSILFTGAEKFNGLESRVVIVIDVNDEWDFWDSMVFYIACTRATEFLSILVDLDDEKLQYVLMDYKRYKSSRPKRMIAEGIRVDLLNPDE